MERPALTLKFVIGAVLIITSLALGKLVLIPLLLFPGNTDWRNAMIAVYAFSWVMLLIGIYIAGVETYHFVKYKYKEYSKKTMHHVKNHSRNAVHQTAKVAGMTVDVLTKPIQRKRSIRLK